MRKKAIDNWRDVKEDLEAYDEMAPNGDRIPTVVDPDSANPEKRTPTALRVTFYRRGFAFKVIEIAHEHGLVVDDVWALESEHENDLLKFKLVHPQNTPLEGGDDDE